MKIFTSEDYASALVENKIFIINETHPFTWTSGLVMPFYCDQRAILCNVDLRKKVIKGLSALVKEIPNYQECALVGVVSAGVPWASMLSEELNLPLGYVRSQKKDHGKKNALEGNIARTMPIILIEDLISTAKSIVQAYNLLKDEGYEIRYGVALFSYGFRGANDSLKNINLPVKTLSNFKALNKQLKTPIKLNSEQKNLFFNETL